MGIELRVQSLGLRSYRAWTQVVDRTVTIMVFHGPKVNPKGEKKGY